MISTRQPPAPLDADRYLRIQTGAVSAATADQLAEAAARIGSDHPSVFFIGGGGASILMQPAAAVLARSSRVATYALTAADYNLNGHPRLGPGSVVVLPSLSGTTEETVDAAARCTAAGACTVALVGDQDSPLARAADIAVVNPAADDTSSESFYLQSLILALTVRHQVGEYPELAETLSQLRRLPEALLEAKRAYESQAWTLATALAADDWHVLCGGGASWPEAHYYGMCILEEMQWIRTRPIDAEVFFHGTLELLEEGVSTLLLLGEDSGRALVERVRRFCLDRTDKLHVLDSRDVALPGLEQPVRELVSPVVLAALLERVSAHLEIIRDHPLTTRRYYRKVAY